MNDSGSSTAFAIIDKFLDDYQAHDGTALDDDALRTARSVLEDFLLDEWWLQECNPSAALLANIDALEKPDREVDGFGNAVQRLRLGVQALAARLTRSEHALEIQREHCMMLSEDLKRRAHRSSQS